MGGLPTQLKKPTHFTKKEVLKHLSLKDDQFRKLLIHSGIYIKWPNHRRYKGRRDKKYYSKTDIKYLRNSVYYRYLHTLNKHNKKLIKAEGKCMALEVNLIKERTPISPVLEMIENRYADFKSLLTDIGEEVSNLAILTYNEELFNLLLKYEKKSINFVLNNNLENIKNTFYNFNNLIKKEKLLTNVFLSSNYAILTCFIYKQRITIRIPYCNLNNDLKCIKEGKLPKQKDIKIDLSLYQDYGNYSQKVMEYVLEYINKNYNILINDNKQKSNVFDGINVLFITENFNKDIIELVSLCGGVESFDVLNKENKGKIDMKNKTHIITDLNKEQIDKVLDENELKINKQTEVTHLQWLVDSFNRNKMLPESIYGLNKKLPLHKNMVNENLTLVKNKEGKKLELAKAMMSSVKEEIYEEVKRRVG